MPVVLVLAQLEHARGTAMKHTVSTGFSVRVLQKLFRKRRSLNTVPLPTEVCKPMTTIFLLRSDSESLWKGLYRMVCWISGDQLCSSCYQNRAQWY